MDEPLPSNGSVNSQIAAIVHAMKAPSERVRIYLWLLENGPATDEEIERRAPGLRRSSRVRTRRNELRDRYLVEAEESDGVYVTRPTESGCDSQVWRAVITGDVVATLTKPQSAFPRRARHDGRRKQVK